jgi:hypothetical protein
MHKIFLGFLFLCMVVLIGCASFKPRPMEETAFRDRSQTQDEDNLRVTAAVLSAEESKAVLGVPLYKKGIQPVWLEIENQDDKPIWFLPYSVDRALCLQTWI